MKNSYKFFEHKECEFYPCHQHSFDTFNCLFCYCPLYLVEDCGGNFEMLDLGIKNCGDCLLPHKASNYEYITNKLRSLK